MIYKVVENRCTSCGAENFLYQFWSSYCAKNQKHVLLQHSNHNKEELSHGKICRLKNMQQILSQTVQVLFDIYVFIVALDLVVIIDDACQVWNYNFQIHKKVEVCVKDFMWLAALIKNLVFIIIFRLISDLPQFLSSRE